MLRDTRENLLSPGAHEVGGTHAPTSMSGTHRPLFRRRLLPWDGGRAATAVHPWCDARARGPRR